jgi:hypothetical protein
MSHWPPLRGWRGAQRVSTGLCLEGATDVPRIVAACRSVAASRLGVEAEILVALRDSRARPSARGRAVAGTITLFPRAFADPFTLAWTLLHELAHVAHHDEHEAEAFAASVLGAS